MSGVYCGGCGEGDLVKDPAGAGPAPVICELCGWTDPDVTQIPFESRIEDDEPWTKRQRKAAGRLHFLWIDFAPGEHRGTFGAMEVLGLRGLTSSGRRALVELERRPSDETLERLRAVTGVVKAWIIP